MHWIPSARRLHAKTLTYQILAVRDRRKYGSADRHRQKVRDRDCEMHNWKREGVKDKGLCGVPASASLCILFFRRALGDEKSFLCFHSSISDRDLRGRKCGKMCISLILRGYDRKRSKKESGEKKRQRTSLWEEPGEDSFKRIFRHDPGRTLLPYVRTMGT